MASEEEKNEFVSNKDTLTRLVKLETKIQLKFEEVEKALVLAREQIERDKVFAREQIERDRITAKEQLEQRLTYIENSNEAKHDDLEKKMTKLNELRQELVRDRSMFLLKEVYDKDEKVLTDWKTIIVKQITEGIGGVITRITATETRSLTWISVIGFLCVLASILIAVFRK